MCVCVEGGGGEAGVQLCQHYSSPSEKESTLKESILSGKNFLL